MAKIVFLAVAGIVVVAICNVNRGSFLPIVGVPWVVPLVLVVLAIWTVLLERTQFGRHMYAVGGNAEAARRAGINVRPRPHARPSSCARSRPASPASSTARSWAA